MAGLRFQFDRYRHTHPQPVPGIRYVDPNLVQQGSTQVRGFYRFRRKLRSGGNVPYLARYRVIGEAVGVDLASIPS